MASRETRVRQLIGTLVLMTVLLATGCTGYVEGPAGIGIGMTLEFSRPISGQTPTNFVAACGTAVVLCTRERMTREAGRRPARCRTATRTPAIGSCSGAMPSVTPRKRYARSCETGWGRHGCARLLHPLRLSTYLRTIASLLAGAASSRCPTIVMTKLIAAHRRNLASRWSVAPGRALATGGAWRNLRLGSSDNALRVGGRFEGVTIAKSPVCLGTIRFASDAIPSGLHKTMHG